MIALFIQAMAVIDCLVSPLSWPALRQWLGLHQCGKRCAWVVIGATDALVMGAAKAALFAVVEQGVEIIKENISMLSYVHAYHAGNFADVLKHVVLVQVLLHLKQKEKPILYVETHAGAGVYTLKQQSRVPTQEFLAGIGRLWPSVKVLGESASQSCEIDSKLPAALQDYLRVIAEFNGDELTHYPGSPAIAHRLLRAQDQLMCAELHPTAFRQLNTQVKNNFRSSAAGDFPPKAYPRCHVFQRDGLMHLKASVPPVKGRACILLDPAYEVKAEYQQVVDALVDAHRRFSPGIYLLWYPVIERERVRMMETALTRSGIRRISCIELCVAKDETGRGMTGSGLFLINAPWTLERSLEVSLGYLREHLAKDGNGCLRIETLVGE